MVCRSGTTAHGAEHFSKHPSQAMYLIDQIQNDADSFVIDTQIVLQVPNQLSACDVGIRKRHFTGRLARNEPLLFDPRLERLTLELSADQEFLLTDYHDFISRRGSYAFPPCQPAVKASSSGSGCSGNTTFKLTSSSP